jgi:hypothetical protein
MTLPKIRRIREHVCCFPPCVFVPWSKFATASDVIALSSTSKGIRLIMMTEILGDLSVWRSLLTQSPRDLRFVSELLIDWHAPQIQSTALAAWYIKTCVTNHTQAEELVVSLLNLDLGCETVTPFVAETILLPMLHHVTPSATRTIPAAIAKISPELHEAAMRLRVDLVAQCINKGVHPDIERAAGWIATRRITDWVDPEIFEDMLEQVTDDATSALVIRGLECFRVHIEGTDPPLAAMLKWCAVSLRAALREPVDESAADHEMELALETWSGAREETKLGHLLQHLKM